jgi:hypothetical protein
MGIAIIFSTKNSNTVYFLSNFWEVNKRLVRNPFHPHNKHGIARARKDSLLQQPLILRWAITPLDWIQMHPKICTIFPWGKYSYKQLPMGIAGSQDIFQ